MESMVPHAVSLRKSAMAGEGSGRELANSLTFLSIASSLLFRGRYRHSYISAAHLRSGAVSLSTHAFARQRPPKSAPFPSLAAHSRLKLATPAWSPESTGRRREENAFQPVARAKRKHRKLSQASSWWRGFFANFGQGLGSSQERTRASNVVCSLVQNEGEVDM